MQKNNCNHLLLFELEENNYHHFIQNYDKEGNIIKKKIFFTTFLLIPFVLIYVFDLENYLNLNYVKKHLLIIQDFAENNNILFISSSFFIYVVMASFSIPGATILSMALGAIIGLSQALILVSFASSIGATFAFLMARYLMRDLVEKKFDQIMRIINSGIDRDGALYLFTLRLTPIFPFFMINLIMGLTKIKIMTFYFVSQIGMFLGTFVYINAGTQLASIEKINDIFSLKLFFSFFLLGIFPLLAKKIIIPVIKKLCS